MRHDRTDHWCWKESVVAESRVCHIWRALTWWWSLDRTISWLYPSFFFSVFLYDVRVCMYVCVCLRARLLLVRDLTPFVCHGLINFKLSQDCVEWIHVLQNCLENKIHWSQSLALVSILLFLTSTQMTYVLFENVIRLQSWSLTGLSRGWCC